MILPELLAVFMVVAVCALLFAGYPVALTLGGVPLAFALIGHAAGVMDLLLLGALPQRIFGVMTSEVLLAVPLFIFMGVMLERSRIAEDLLETMGLLFGARPGGLGIAAIVVGALLAASTGIVGATAVTIGVVMLPLMMRHGYDPRLASGTVAASATLAQIIPPSTVLVLLGDQLGNAYQAAQLSQGIFAPRAVSVADLFAGALVPGLALVGLYLAYLVAVAMRRPEMAPPVVARARAGDERERMRRLGEVLAAPALLIVAVLGSILGGFATPTEAAAVGAYGALLLTARKVEPARAWLVALAVICLAAVIVLRATTGVRIGASGAGAAEILTGAVILILLTAAALCTVGALLAVRRAGVLASVVNSTASITCMIFLILIGATLFSLVFRGLGGDDLVHRALSDLPGGVAGAILIVMLAMFLLGFVMDAFEIIFVVVPIVAPVLLKMPGVDPVWLGIMMAVNLQTSYMHPPLGPTLFYLRSIAPPEIATRHIYIGTIPFVAIQLVALVVLWFVPALATALPRALYGGG